jgi:hypothetical protein
MVDSFDDKTFTLPAKKKSNSKVIVHGSQNGDGRTKLEGATREDIYNDVLKHIKDVQLCMNKCSAKVAQAGMLHDNTKVIYNEEYIDLVDKGVVDDDFIKSDWWVKHIHEERHHLLSNVPVDVNLFDVLEMIVDVIVAGKARKGYFDSEDLNLDMGVLLRAYWNTVKFVDDMVVRK